jgi:hypothetical protein
MQNTYTKLTNKQEQTLFTIIGICFIIITVIDYCTN